MTGVLDVTGLAQPIMQLLASFGDGSFPSDGPAAVLKATSVTLETVHAVGKSGLGVLESAWSGRTADNATNLAVEAQNSTANISDRGNSIADVVTSASAEITAGMVEIEGILQSFISIAVASAPTLTTPAGLAMIVEVATEHLGRALAVVAKVQAKLSVHATQMAELTPQVSVPTALASAATAPAVSTAETVTSPSKVSSENMLTNSVPVTTSSPTTTSGPRIQNAVSTNNHGTNNHSSNNAAPTGPAPTGEVADWIQQALAVLRENGVDTSQIDPSHLAAIIAHESAGDPHAINLWDSNYTAGHPSKGIMQTIDSTFSAYAVAGHGDIWNPVDNIVAATRYAIDTYGSVGNVPGIQGVQSGTGYVGY
jgi:hypothetical protein